MNTQFDQINFLRAKYEKNYNSGRSNLLLAIAFTIVSMITYYFNGSYFLFSAFTPLIFYMVFADYSLIASGQMEWPEAEQEFIEILEAVGAGTWLAIGIVIALVMLGVYFLCWLLSKKHTAALIVATVFFGIDCLVVLLNFDMSMIMDVLFHAWVMYYLINAIVSKNKLKNLPTPVIEATYTESAEAIQPVSVDEWGNPTSTDENSEQN